MGDSLSTSRPARVGARLGASKWRRARLGGGKTRSGIALVTCLYILAQALLPHLHWGASARLERASCVLEADAYGATHARIRSAPGSHAEHHESTCAVCQARAQSAKFLPSPAVQLLRIAASSSAIAGADVASASVASGAKSARAPPLLS